MSAFFMFFKSVLPLGGNLNLVLVPFLRGDGSPSHSRALMFTFIYYFYISCCFAVSARAVSLMCLSALIYSGIFCLENVSF